MLARLVWTILRALGSQGARQPHLGGTHNHRREAPGKWYHFTKSKGGSKSAFKGVEETGKEQGPAWRGGGEAALRDADKKEK